MKSTYSIALMIAIVLLAWLASGQFSSDDKTAITSPEAERELVRVRTQSLISETHTLQIIARGKTQAKRIVQVRAETDGRVVHLPVEKGAVVEKNTVLCQLSMEDRDIKYKKAQAAVKEATLEHQGALKLSQQGYQSEINIAGTNVRLIEARAELRARQLDLEYRNIRAPFRAILQERPVEIGDYLQRGDICAEVMDPDPMLIVAHVSEQEVILLEPGLEATARLNSGEQLKGNVAYISHTADNTTRTYRIEVEVPNPGYTLRDGLSADVFLPRHSVMAYRVSPALLSLTDEGLIGIKILDNDDVVQFVEVEIVSDSEDGVWLTGLPAAIRLITLGQELVFPGQQVEPVPHDAVTRVSP